MVSRSARTGRRKRKEVKRAIPRSAAANIRRTSCYPEHGTAAEVLQQNADIAMYHAKFCGKNGFQVFTPEINAHLRERLGLLGDLRQALERGEFSLEYQPQFLADGELVGFEALLRWRDPERGTISPDKFIPIAEAI